MDCIFVPFMKKVILSIVLICYLAVSTGVMVNSHFCMNKLASTQVFGGKSKQCGKCGMHMDKAHGCCRDESTIIKMDNDQKQASVIADLHPDMGIPVSTVSAFIQTSFYNTPFISSYTDHPPPLLSGQDTYLQIQVFRI